MSRSPKHVERREKDAYYTPDELAEALVDLLPIRRDDGVWEPHVGAGAFARALRLRTPHVWVSDIDPTAAGLLNGSWLRARGGRSFLDMDWRTDWIVGNPPFREAEEHIRHARTLAPNVAFLLRLGMLESRKRIGLWKEHPPAKVWVLSERPSFTGGSTDSAAYGFFVWRSPASRVPPELGWVSWRKG